MAKVKIEIKTQTVTIHWKDTADTVTYSGVIHYNIFPDGRMRLWSGEQWDELLGVVEMSKVAYLSLDPAPCHVLSHKA